MSKKDLFPGTLPPEKDPGKRPGLTPSQVAHLTDRNTGDLFKKARSPVSARQYEGDKSIIARRTINTPDNFEPGIKKLAGDLPF